MWSSPDIETELWAAIGPDSLLEALAPLVDEQRRTRAVALFPGDARDLDKRAAALGHRATVLVLEDPAQASIRARYDSPFLTRTGGPDVLLGWLRLDERELARYARRAAALLKRRDAATQPVVLLGPRERRYLELLDDLERTGHALPRLKVFRWSAERIRREPVLHALHLGAAAVLYTGHGNRDGWFAYGSGVNIDALAAGEDWPASDTSALMLSMSCRTGAPDIPGIGSGALRRPCFADGIVARGVAGAVLAPRGDPLHADNRILATRLLHALGTGRKGLREILELARSEGASLKNYAVIGDPALMALASPEAVQRGARVFAPAADAELVPGDVARGLGYS